MGCLQSIIRESSNWLFGIKEQCPDLSESARIGVSVMFSTLFIIVLLFAASLKKRLAIIEAENESLRKEMIRLQMLTLDMIDTVISDSAINPPKISSDNYQQSTSDNIHLSTSDIVQPRDSCSSGYLSNNSEINLLNHSNGFSVDHYKYHCLKTALGSENSFQIQNDNDDHNFNEPNLAQEIHATVIGQDFSRIRMSDRLRLRNSTSKTF